MKIKKVIFYLGFGTFATHELDAMTHHEWRVLPLTSWMPDEYGMYVFLFMHIPLFAVLLALVASRNEKVRFRSRVGISIFLFVHGLLHSLFIRHENYEFIHLSSNILIFGGAALGFVYLLLGYIDKHTGNA